MSTITEAIDRYPEEKMSMKELTNYLAKPNKNDPEEMKYADYENIALSFVATHDGSGDYYRPCISGKNADGVPFEFPSKGLIDKTTLDYWRDRVKTTQNPILKMRYLGLQIEFRPSVGEKASGKERFDYIDSILEAVNGDLFKYALEGFSHLDRALQIAETTKNAEYIAKVKDAYFKYDRKYASDKYPGIFARIVMAAKRFAKLFTQNEKDIIEQSTIDRFERLETSNDYFRFSECADLLVEFYGPQKREQAIGILERLAAKTIANKKDLGAMRTQIFLHRIAQSHYNLSDKNGQERVMKEIEKLGHEVVAEFKPIEIPLNETIQKAIDDANSFMVEGSIQERLKKFIAAYWHHEATDKEQAKEQKQNSLMGLMATVAYDQNGRPATFSSATQGEGEKDAVEYFRTMAPITASAKHPSMIKNIEDNVVGKETVLDIIDHCPAFYPPKKFLIEKALEAYYAADYVVFMHLIIPQIECACRNYVNAKGEGTFNVKDSAMGYSFLTFEGVLRKKCITDIENGDLSYHLRAVFTDNHGLNLRNDVMHGMAPASYFTVPYADIVFHSLILLATFLK